MITIYTVAYNEELQLPYLIKHYRDRFPECEIIVYDNMSNDKTADIALNNNCNVIKFDTNNEFQDLKHIEIKNNCWKTANTDWVLTCDVDELLDINKDQLIEEEMKGSTIIKSEGYNMINMEDNLDITNIKYGVRSIYYDKPYLFNKKFIKEINYDPGCHSCNAIGKINYSDIAYKAYHYNFINLELSIKKYKHYASRLSSENKKNGWGFHYMMAQEKIIEEFMSLRKNAIKLIP